MSNTARKCGRAAKDNASAEGGGVEVAKIVNLGAAHALPMPKDSSELKSARVLMGAGGSGVVRPASGPASPTFLLSLSAPLPAISEARFQKVFILRRRRLQVDTIVTASGRMYRTVRVSL